MKGAARMQRVRELDAMRGLAAIAIVVYHLWVLPISLLGAAVDLFFVLSGYLITSIILSHPPSERFLLAFYVRRGLRIWPIYYLSLFVVVAINPWTPRPGSLGGLPYFLTFTQNLPYYWSDVAPSFITAFRHTWSLAVEEQFYIVWPALLWVVGRKGLGPAALSLVALATVTRSLDWYPWILATHCARSRYVSTAFQDHPEHASSQSERVLLRIGRPHGLACGPSPALLAARSKIGLLRPDQLWPLTLPSRYFYIR
jgi:peptidoglycan/LPS O-acetylase OafA/YrhL